MLCYGKEFENQVNDNEQSNREKDLKGEIDAIKEKICAFTEEKEKCEKEYHRMCNLKKYGNLLKEDSSTNY